MGDFGYKINNYEAGSVYEVMCGVRKKYDTKCAMLTNSLFLDFLKANGLNTRNEKYTRDVICLNFNYGSRTYEDELSRIDASLEEDPDNTYLKALREECVANKDKFDCKSADEIRKIFYENGVTIHYKSGDVKYRYLYRTAGKAKVGSCMFIKQSLYKKAHDFLYMGLKLPKHDAPITEFGAYTSLVTSTIVGKIEINPEDIVILNDVRSEFQTNVVSVEVENNQCKAVYKQNYTLGCDMFDGQALIDLSICPEWTNGYLLLRQHFMKAAAFATDLQGFFKDYFGQNYDIAYLTDMWGNKHLAKNVKVITTNNATKWVKYSVTYEQWCEKVRENGSMFGIVKTAHPSKFGDYQRMSYQMVNALNNEFVEEVAAPTRDYVKALKTDLNTYLDFLKRNANFSNDYDALIALWTQDHSFEQSEYFRERKKKIIYDYTMSIKTGKLLQIADNLVLCGSPYAMLLHSVGEDVNKDPTFESELDTIQCYTERFDDGEYLAEFRNPFNSQNNLGYLHNRLHPLIKKYFRLGQQCMAVNVLGTSFCDRNNGSDFDSDSVYTTNAPAIVSHAKYCYRVYPTIVNNIPKSKKSYDSSPAAFAEMDNLLSASQRNIGESSNLAQVCLTYTFNYPDQKFKDYACILAVLAQAAIDSSKRTFSIDITNEIKRIRADIGIKDNKYPPFWQQIRKGFPTNRINFKLDSPMCRLYRMEFESYKPETETIPTADFFQKYPLDMSKKMSRNVEELIEKYQLELLESRIDKDDCTSDMETYLLLREDFEQLVDDIRRIALPSKYIGLFSWLLDRAFIMTPQMEQKVSGLKSKLNKNRAILLRVLYEVNPEALLKCFAKNL